MQYPWENVFETGLRALAETNATLVTPGSQAVEGQVYVNASGASDAFPNSLPSAVIGLPYQCVLRTLKPVYAPRNSTQQIQVGLDAFRKLIQDVWLTVFDSRGLKVGATIAQAVELEARRAEHAVMGEVPLPKSDGQYYLIGAQWSDTAEIYVIQDYPLAANLLSIVYNMDMTLPSSEGAAAVLGGDSS